MSTKIQTQHLQKAAYVYLRQSTMKQVRFNQESTERQYALKEKAQNLGWETKDIKILDGDLGLSGTQSFQRKDFQTLVADVSMGKVGAVFALEASRLSRSNTDWHRLLEICSFTGTLIIDEDGCYNPSDFNDQLLLGLKGTMSQAELHFIRARLLGGKKNKAKKGELRSPLPVGLCYDEAGKTILDPNLEVQGAVALVFELFREEGSAYGVSQRFYKDGLKFPRRSYGGAWNGKIIWGNLGDARVSGILRNPSYAGVYTYGRYGYEKHVSPDGRIKTKTIRKDLKDCEVVIKNHHQGYITFEEYQENINKLEGNRTNIAENMLPTFAREGLALLQGLLICKECGRKVSVRYKGNNGRYPLYECNKKKQDGISTKSCLNVQANLVDKVIFDLVSKIVNETNIESAINVYNELEARSKKVSRQWEMRLQEAQYRTDLAQRRYEEVDPSNRLVALTLEKQWNEALSNLEDIESKVLQSKESRPLQNIGMHKSELIKLSKSFPRLWRSDDSAPKDRKRILRLLVKDITIGNLQENRKKVILQIRWQGGACEEITIDRLKPTHEKWEHPTELIERVRKMAIATTDLDIVKILNKEGLKTNKGNDFTECGIKWIRYKHKIPPMKVRRENEFTAKEVMKKFGVSYYVVDYWIKRKIVDARQNKKGAPWWIKVDPDAQLRLTSWVNQSSRINVSPTRNGGSAI